MLSDTVQRVAEDKRPVQMCVKEWSYAHVISAAKKALLKSVPNSKREIAEKLFDRVLTPNPVGTKKQFDIGCAGFHMLTTRLQLRNQVSLSIHSCVGDDPDHAVKSEGLVFMCGFTGGSEQCM